MPLASDLDFLSCDWGTSHFRLRWGGGGGVVREFQDENGCKRLLKASRQNPELSRAHFYEDQLGSALKGWEEFRLEASELPLVISGMASSTIGWVELPYAKAPVRLDGIGFKVQKVTWAGPAWIGETFLVSGVATSTNMMRGEETEMAGLLAETMDEAKSALLVLPGTHSKHLQIENGELQEITTYMTGELFEVLTRHSVLAASVSGSGGFKENGFADGVRRACEGGVAANLFLTRTRQVLEGMAPEENASFLSGLLIGAELNEAVSKNPGALLIGGSRKLRDIYSRALEKLGARNWRCFSDEECQNAVPVGQQLILKRLRT